MGRYNFKRTGAHAALINDMPRHPKEEEPKSTALLYRQVTGQSVDELNAITRGIRNKRVARIRDYFTLPMIFEHQVERAREASPIDRPPSAEEIIAELVESGPASLHKNVSAEILGVKPHHRAAGVLVDYEDRELEQRDMERAVHRLLSLPGDYEVRLGSAEAHINVTIGKPTIAQFDTIRATMPSRASLSPAIPRTGMPSSQAIR